MRVDLGGTLDTAFTTDPSFANGTCAKSATLSTLTQDVVLCNYGFLAAGQAEPSVQIAVRTPAAGASMTSVASESGTPDSTVPLPEPVPDNDETATVVTGITTNPGTGTLTDGQSMTFTSSDGTETTAFSVPANATHGGAVTVTLDKVDTTTNAITCGGGACYKPAAQARWQQTGGTPVTASNPFITKVTYNNIKQSCAGLGGPSGCMPVFYLATGVTTGNAQSVPLCDTYSTSHPVAHASHDPCVFSITKSMANVVTYLLAELNDQIIPISLPGK